MGGGDDQANGPFVRNRTVLLVLYMMGKDFGARPSSWYPELDSEAARLLDMECMLEGREEEKRQAEIAASRAAMNRK